MSHALKPPAHDAAVLAALVLLTLGVLALAGCGHVAEPPPPVVLSGSCVPDNVSHTPDPDSYPDTADRLLGFADEGPQRTQAIYDGNKMRKERLDILEPTVEHCR